MALEFICSDNIVHGKRIKIPMGAETYRLRSGIVRFFKFNPNISENGKRIPKDANSMSFSSYEKHKGWIFYGQPIFYNSEERL